MKQEEALQLLKLGKNIFLTGEAGSGKTYLLNKYIQYLKDHNVKVAITASTGIAATHLQGMTIHGWSGIGVKESLTPQDLEKITTSERIKRHYKKTKVVIIDEISMLHKHQLDMVDVIARHILDKDKPFGGMQIILCGDFFQLPPISADQNPYSEKQFAFESFAWINGDFYVCYLNEQHRQTNDPLYDVLNDIRSGTAAEHTKIPLRTRYKKEPVGRTKATKLYSRNINVDAINQRELANIVGPEKIFEMVTVGYKAVVENLKKSCLALETLKLKVGAEAIFIKNDPHGKYVNGTRCVVIGFEKNNEQYPVVKTYDGNTFIAYPEEWKYEDNGVIRAILTQIPLRLAWAITIHKSQGMTLDAAEIDLGDAFEPGMGYVALSRVRSLNGLKLMNLNEMALKVHPKILYHDNTFKEDSSHSLQFLKNLSEDEIAADQHKTLTIRFGGNKTKLPLKIKKSKSKPIPTHLITLELLKNNMSIETMALERGISVGTVFHHLEKLKSLTLIDNKHLEYLKPMVEPDDFEIIFSELYLSEDGKLSPIYNKFNGQYPYEHIRFVRLFV